MRLSSEKVEYLVVGAITLVAIIAAVDYFTRPVTRPAPYFYIREAVEERLAPRRIARFIPPNELKVESIEENRGRATGWVIYTNASGQVATQWFNAVVGIGSRARGVHDLQLFREPPRQIP